MAKEEKKNQTQGYLDVIAGRNEVPEEEGNTLADLTKAIEKSGKQNREEHQKIRDELLSRPHTIVSEIGTKLGLWKEDNCVIEAVFHGDIIDIYSIRYYSFDFVDALHRVRNQ